MPTPIQEYLIALGFKLDDPGYRRFNETLDATRKKFADLDETFFYLSQRTGSTIASLQSMAFGFSQIGLSAGDAKSVVDNLAMALRTNPGNSAILQMLGVGGGGAAEISLNLIERLSRMPFFLAAQYAQMFGMSPMQLIQMENNLPKLRREEEFHTRLLKDAGIQTVQLADDSVAFMTGLRELGDEFEVVGQKVTQDFIKPAIWVVDELRDMTGWFLKVDTATQGWVTTIGSLVVSFGALRAAGATMAWIAGIFGAGTGTKAAIGGLTGAGLAGAAASGLTRGGLVGWSLGALGVIGADQRSGNTLRDSVRSWLHDTFGWNLADAGQPGGAAGVSGQSGWWTPERQQHALQTLVAGGLTPLGAAALVSRWMNVESAGGPSSLNPKSGAFGIGQWLGTRKPGIAGDTNFDDQLSYALSELHGSELPALGMLNSATTAWDAARGASMYERAHGYNAALGTDDYTGRTAAGITIGPPQTTIHVTGGADPQATADRVLMGQAGIWADVIRMAGDTVR